MILWGMEHKLPLVDLLKVENPQLTKLLFAAFYHDTGQREGAQAHEIRSVEFAKANLADFFDQKSLDEIGGRIMATCMERRADGRICQVPAKDLADAILQDADMFNLGSTDCLTQWKISCSLYKELFGASDLFAYDNSTSFIDDSIKFFKDHQYQTASGQRLLDLGKAHNIHALQLKSLSNMFALATI